MGISDIRNHSQHIPTVKFSLPRATYAINTHTMVTRMLKRYNRSITVFFQIIVNINNTVEGGQSQAFLIHYPPGGVPLGHLLQLIVNVLGQRDHTAALCPSPMS